MALLAAEAEDLRPSRTPAGQRQAGTFGRLTVVATPPPAPASVPGRPLRSGTRTHPPAPAVRRKSGPGAPVVTGVPAVGDQSAGAAVAAVRLLLAQPERTVVELVVERVRVVLATSLDGYQAGAGAGAGVVGGAREPRPWAPRAPSSRLVLVAQLRNYLGARAVDRVENRNLDSCGSSSWVCPCPRAATCR